MTLGIYIVTSPNFPNKADFDRFSVWSEWSKPEDSPLSTLLFESLDDYDDILFTPHQLKEESYYPIPNLIELPWVKYCFIKVSVQISDERQFNGYVSTVNNEVVAITIWPTLDDDAEVHLYRQDRLVAEIENPERIRQLSSIWGVSEFKEIAYSSRYTLSSGEKVNGILRCLA